MDRYYFASNEFDYVGSRAFVRHVNTRLPRYREFFLTAERSTGPRVGHASGKGDLLADRSQSQELRHRAPEMIFAVTGGPTSTGGIDGTLMVTE